MKKILSIVGMVSGAFIIIIGLLTLFGAFGVADSTSYSYYKYDHGYASFGGDYYTYSSNNAYYAATAANAASQNIMDMAHMIQLSSGLLFVGLGTAILCAFGIMFAGYKKNDENAAAHNNNTTIEAEEKVINESSEQAVETEQ